MDETGAGMFTITDLKQYSYCPRIFYYHACLPKIRPVTYKMRAGIDAHEDEHKRSLRRSMGIEQMMQGERFFDVQLVSETLGLSGQLDELVQHEGGYIPIDYKLARKAGFHFKIQLTAYAMLVEALFEVQVEYGLLYMMLTRKTEKVRFTPKLRQHVEAALAQMQAIANDESMPAPTEWRQRCADCEFRRFCNDV